MQRASKKKTKTPLGDPNQIAPDVRARILAMAPEVEANYRQASPEHKRKLARMHAKFMKLVKFCS
jgi:hypothetical protein